MLEQIADFYVLGANLVPCLSWFCTRGKHWNKATGLPRTYPIYFNGKTSPLDAHNHRNQHKRRAHNYKQQCNLCHSRHRALYRYPNAYDWHYLHHGLRRCMIITCVSLRTMHQKLLRSNPAGHTLAGTLQAHNNVLNFRRNIFKVYGQIEQIEMQNFMV